LEAIANLVSQQNHPGVALQSPNVGAKHQAAKSAAKFVALSAGYACNHHDPQHTVGYEPSI
jgi:hypothetical protein